MNIEKLIEIFVTVDDFCKEFIPYMNQHMLKNNKCKVTRSPRLSSSEIMTIILYYHESNFKNLKSYYCYLLSQHHNNFPHLVSYNRFVELMQRCFMPLLFFIQSGQKSATGCYFVDSTVIKACHIKRESSHKVFKGLAQKSKGTMGWFFGFKLHLVVNDLGELMNFTLTPGNIDDRKPVLKMMNYLQGKLFGDRGYISQELFEKLYEKGVTLITKIKKTMKNVFMSNWDKYMLRKRAIIETIIDQLKNISDIEHTRHRSVANFCVNLIAGLGAYAMKPKKPAIKLQIQ